MFYKIVLIIADGMIFFPFIFGELVTISQLIVKNRLQVAVNVLLLKPLQIFIIP